MSSKRRCDAKAERTRQGALGGSIGKKWKFAFPALFEGLEEFDSEEPQLAGGLLPKDSCRNGRRFIGDQA